MFKMGGGGRGGVRAEAERLPAAPPLPRASEELSSRAGVAPAAPTGIRGPSHALEEIFGARAGNIKNTGRLKWAH